MEGSLLSQTQACCGEAALGQPPPSPNSRAAASSAEHSGGSTQDNISPLPTELGLSTERGSGQWSVSGSDLGNFWLCCKRWEVCLHPLSSSSVAGMKVKVGSWGSAPPRMAEQLTGQLTH